MSEIKISLAAARVNAKMTQSDVAEKLHVAKASIVAWENGKSIPRYSTVKSLCELYGIPIDYIFLPFELTKSES